MQAYSLDLRERIVQACAVPGARQVQVAACFCVSVAFVGKLLRRQRQTARPRRPRPLPGCGRADVAGGSGGADAGPDTGRVTHRLDGRRWPARVFTRALARTRRARAATQKKACTPPNGTVNGCALCASST